MQVFEIFTSNPVDPGVKKSAGDQLATMLRGELPSEIPKRSRA